MAWERNPNLDLEELLFVILILSELLYKSIEFELVIFFEFWIFVFKYELLFKGRVEPSAINEDELLKVLYSIVLLLCIFIVEILLKLFSFSLLCSVSSVRNIS
jgi:hypothetical protein